MGLVGASMLVMNAIAPALMEPLAHAAGYEHPAQVSGEDIEFSTGINQFSTLNAVLGYRRDEVRFTCMADYGPTP